MSDRPPALLVAQSGGCTAAINASLAGVVEEALTSREIGPILGARHGVEGMLSGSVVDLRDQDPSLWPAIRTTPSAALGSCRRKLTAEERSRILDWIVERNIRYMLYIGGNDSADSALALHAAAAGIGYDLRVVSVPKTIDNDLPATDHCPGYGSAARFVAQTTQDAGLDTEAMRGSDPLKIIEVMGRDAGWLAAAAILGKRRASDAPHVICVPERPLDVDRFVGAMEDAYRAHGYAVAVVAETVRDLSGQPLGTSNEVQAADAFGHPTLAGAAQALTGILGRALGLKARFDKPGTIQRMNMALASSVDLDEAYRAGRTAVQFALEGQSAVMVGFRRTGDDPYRCRMEPVDLRLVANRIRTLPPEYLGADPFALDPSFARYAEPLIGPGLLPYARLRF